MYLNIKKVVKSVQAELFLKMVCLNLKKKKKKEQFNLTSNWPQFWEKILSSLSDSKKD